jgi:hypothetical protein
MGGRRQTPRPLTDQLEPACVRRVHRRLLDVTTYYRTVSTLSGGRWAGTLRRGKHLADSELARLQRCYHELTDQICELGFIATGSVVERYTVCAAAGCHCHADPPTRHGPYVQYTRKVAGKTVTARLTGEQAQRYREQIANRRRLDELVTAMDQIATRARELLDTNPQPAGTTGQGSARQAPDPHPGHDPDPASTLQPATPSRDDQATMSCPVCRTHFTPAGRQQYCASCRKTAFRRRRHPPAAVVVPAAKARRQNTIYECPTCGQRLHGEQRCPHCNVFARRISIGGPCPHCFEPVAVTDLLDQDVTITPER